jgi:hypothetical protein
MLGQSTVFVRWKILKQFFDAFVDPPKSWFECLDLFACHAESEVSRLDNTGVHGADGNFVDTFALYHVESIVTRMYFGHH